MTSKGSRAMIAILFVAIAGIVFSLHKHLLYRQMEVEAGHLLTLTGELRMHDIAYKQLPDAVHLNNEGKACCSWRLVMLDHITKTLGYDIDQPWDSEVNRSLAGEVIPEFCYRSLYSWSGEPVAGVTAVTGPGTPFQNRGSLSLKDVDKETILIVQTRLPKNWMEPGDLSLSQIDQSVLRGIHGDGLIVGFASGEVWKLAPDVPVELLKTFLLAQPPVGRNREKTLRKYCLHHWDADF